MKHCIVDDVAEIHSGQTIGRESVYRLQAILLFPQQKALTTGLYPLNSAGASDTGVPDVSRVPPRRTICRM